MAEPAGAEAPVAGDDNLWPKLRSILPERSVTALWLRYGEERSLEEIAEILEVSAINARVIIHRAREKLAEALGEDYTP